VRINPFGHLGDGNIHYNLSPPEDRGDFDGKAGAFAEALSALATEMGGSFAAEHGLGRAKIALAERNRGAVELELMARLKGAFDPLGTMNPGVLLRTAE
jgi:FAD/FMN-containing dehydrogenase